MRQIRNNNKDYRKIMFTRATPDLTRFTQTYKGYRVRTGEERIHIY